jgi:dihydropteroate synthase
LVADVKSELRMKIKELNDLGFNKILVDVGFGFAKNVGQNFELLSRLDEFRDLGYIVLAGISRKSMIYRSLGVRVEESLNGTTVLNTLALMKGAGILRVHDVKEAVETIKLVRYVLGL